MSDVEYIHLMPTVDTLADALLKIGVDAIEEESLNAEQNAAEAKLREIEERRRNMTEKPNEEMANPNEHRREAQIEGMDNPQSDTPEQPGAELDPIPITRTWFSENYGMTGRQMADLLIKANDLKTLDAIQPLLKMEKKAILDSFVGVSPNLVDELPLTDLDYDSLNLYSDRLDLPFRRFVKSWTSSDDAGKEDAEKTWRSTIDKSSRLSQREQNILTKCAGILIERGALNAQTLRSYGVSASAAEISSLIKSHGFLFDIISVGQFSKSVGRGLFYDVKRHHILLKDADQFLAGLIDNGGRVKLDSRLIPRIDIKFNAPNAPWYVDTLKEELGVENISASGRGIVIEGDVAVKKALDISLPYISDNEECALIAKALEGDRDALIVFAHDRLATPAEKTEILKQNNISYSDFLNIKKEVSING